MEIGGYGGGEGVRCVWGGGGKRVGSGRAAGGDRVGIGVGVGGQQAATEMYTWRYLAGARWISVTRVPCGIPDKEKRSEERRGGKAGRSRRSPDH